MLKNNIFAKLNELSYFSKIFDIVTICKVIGKFRVFSFIHLMYLLFKIGPEEEFEKGSFGKTNNF